MSDAKRKVLLVDDDEAFLDATALLLEDAGFEVLKATDGPSGLAAAREHRPDAIVLDVMMPGMHGWDVLQRLRNHPRTLDIPVIVCSVVNDQALGRVLGASAYLTKPIGRPALLQALEEAARQYRPVSRG